MPYEFGTIVLVPFPFTDQSASKQRPAVIISDQAYNRLATGNNNRAASW
jgi:mRNA interferase MazF